MSREEFVIGQLLALAPPGKEVWEILRNFKVLQDSSSDKIPANFSKLCCDFAEKNHLRLGLKQAGSSFIVSRFNRLEPMMQEKNDEDLSHICYYSSFLTGEVFSVDFLNGMVVEKVLDNFNSSHQTSPLLDKIISYITQNNLMGQFHVLETDDPNQVMVLNGLTESAETNCWSLHSACRWRVAKGAESAYFSLTGEINTYIHYYENCNFHLTLSKLKVHLSDGSLDSIDSVFEKIKRKVFKLKLKLNSKFVLLDADFERSAPSDGSRSTSAASSSKYSSVGGIQPVSILKKLRRQLPIHKGKFDWNLARVQLINNL
jgi:hypothetical protein